MSALRSFLALILVVVLVALPGTARAQGTASVTGTLTTLSRASLPANAIVTIQIAQVGAGGANPVVAEQRFSTGGRQVPFSFVLNYDPARISANNVYTLQANISVDNQVRFTTTTQYRVITQGNPVSGINMVLSPIGGGLPPTSGGALPLAIAILLALTAVGVYVARTRLVRTARP
jgi:putative lipoprotein